MIGDKEIKDRWRLYFDNLYNKDQGDNIGDTSITGRWLVESFAKNSQGVKMVLKQMGLKKEVGPMA